MTSFQSQSAITRKELTQETCDRSIKLIPINIFNSVKFEQSLTKILNNLKFIFKRHDTPFIDYKYNDNDDNERENVEMQIREKELLYLKECIRSCIDSEIAFGSSYLPPDIMGNDVFKLESLPVFKLGSYSGDICGSIAAIPWGWTDYICVD
eukprot:67354_1